jgi:hypothetical protein
MHLNSSFAVLTISGVLFNSTLLAGEGEFEPIFDGASLKSWHISAKTGHSRASKNSSGGKWVIEDGAIVGSQDIPGNGGIVLTDEQFGDFEVALEMNNDFGPDSGLFLRSTEDGKAWQAMIDYHAGGNLMGVYGEGIGGKPSVRNFTFLDKVTQIRADPAPVALPVLPEAWPNFWRHGQWNELRARIVGNPPAITTWINGVKFMEWTETQVRHPARGSIALQVHGGGDFTKQFVRYRNIRVKRLDLPDNTLTDAERSAGWLLLFDGKTTAGWMNSNRTAPRTPVEEGALNPHKAGHYMLVHTQQWTDYVLKLDFKLSKGCNSGVFVRTYSLDPRPGKDIGFNGLEIALDDTTTAGYHDTGAIYDLIKPAHNTMKPIGQWNHLEVTCDKNLISVNINGELVTRMDMSEFPRLNKRPDGSDHKFDIAFKNHPHTGYIGLQDHGSPCWFKNIKLKPLR